MSIHTQYLTTIFDRDEFAAAIRAAMDDLSGVAFDSIAVSGNSGAIFGGALSVAMNKALFLVRKPRENSHSDYPVEGDSGARAYLFVDDCVASGATLRRVHQKMADHFPDAVFVGTYTYRFDCSRGRKFVSAADEAPILAVAEVGL
jgi:adenine/guanine phosphoribosyltransferase-like PRPP-binding protein